MLHTYEEKMLKFIRGKGHQPSAERLKIQKDLFGFSKAIRHGFPNKPTSFAFDPELKLLALGTKQGLLRIYGRPGVEFYGQHEQERSVSQVVFLPGQGRLVTLTDDNHLHLWEIGDSSIQETRLAHLDGRLKHITTMCPDMENRRILLGTEGGNIYNLNLWNFKIDDNIIYQDMVMTNAPDDFKVNPGAVEGLLLHPVEKDRLLIGYARGLIAIWDRASNSVSNTYVANQQLESVSWRQDGSQFISAHNDGSFIIWSESSSDPLEPPNTPYGPFPCKAINKIIWSFDNGTAWTFFSGGMLRASFGDKHTITLMKGDEKHTVFDLASKVIDFLVINEEESGVPNTLLILTEEELVAVDLTDESWPLHSLPYLNAIHASAIMCITQVRDVDSQVYDKVCTAGRNDSKEKYSDKPWPISGGNISNCDKEDGGKKDFILTGHEDGSVKFWSCGSTSLSPLATVRTKTYFVGDDLDEPCEEEEDEWPPFKKVGHFDPYSDDPRMAVKKLAFCGKSGRLMVGGTAGQVVLFEPVDEAREAKLTCAKADLVTEKEGFTWKGHNPLTVRTNEIKLEAGIQPISVVQISPPASLNSITYCPQWDLLAAGTAHGLIVYDCLQNTVVTAKCTLSAQDMANADDNPMSRRKSLKKSLRESFRRLRKGRSQRNADKKKSAAPGTNSATTPTADPIKRELRSESPEARPVERAVEARTGAEDGLGSMVRCLHFAHTYVANPQTISATLWAGTNSGQILVFIINMAVGEKRKSEKVSAMLAKEIQLKHKAPVISINVLDSSGVPVPEPGNPSQAAAEGPLPHRVMIASEEQFKMFTLPALKPSGKYKLTVHEGSRVRKVGFVTFHSKSDPNYTENCLSYLTNQGDVATHSLPDLRRQVVQTSCMRKEDVIAISSFIFTAEGEAFYQCSSSEIQRLSIAASSVVEAKGTISVEFGKKFEIRDEESKESTSKTASDVKVVGGEEAAGDTDSVVARQNRLNERQAQVAKSPLSRGTDGGDGVVPKDQHNDTTVSDISADITVDSVKDHTMSQPPPEVVVTDTGLAVPASSSSTVTKTEKTEISDGRAVRTETVTTVVREQSVSSGVVVHEAVINGTPEVLERVTTSLESAELGEKNETPQQSRASVDLHLEENGEPASAPLASLESSSDV